MALSFCILASGSSGNCSLVRFRDRCMLIDAGISPRRAIKRLGPLGVSPDEITDILLTHVDTDHFSPRWLDLDPPLPARWRAHRRHMGRLAHAGMRPRDVEPFDGPFDLGGGTRIEPVLLPHDDLGACGFVIDNAGSRLGWATDLGRVTKTLAGRFRGLAALAIESNYDRQMLLASPRPPALKRRIMGGLGHLSNEQALEAIRLIEATSDLAHVALLHLSRQCNDPVIVRRLYATQAPHLLGRMTITNQWQSTPVLRVDGDRASRGIPAGAGRQLDFLELLPPPAA